MEQFYIFRKSVGGRVSDDYFKDYNIAKKALLRDIDDCKRWGFVVTDHKDYFNHSKGFQVYQYNGKTDEGEPVRWSLLIGYFKDNYILNLCK